MLRLHPLDGALIIAFFILQAYLGFGRAHRTRRGDATDYLIGGRTLTLPAFVASLVSTWYGGILGVGEYSYLYGVSNWLVFGLPYYLWALVFALFLARKARRTHFISLPDHLGQAYGRGPGLLGAAVVFIMTVPAAYVLMLGDFGRLLLGWPLWAGAAVGAGLSIMYLFIGGFRSAIRADLLQFVCMFGGFALILPFAIGEYGGWSFLKANLPAAHLTASGGNSWWYIISWYFIATATLVEPAFYQRCYAARNETTATRGIYWSIGFWILFDFMTTTTGLYVRAALPMLENPTMSYPALAAQVLPPGVLGLFFVGLIATVISTVDSYMFLAAVALGRDVMSRLRAMTDQAVQTSTRWALLVSALLAVALALGTQSVIGIWKNLGSIGVPMLLLPVLSTFREQRFHFSQSFVVVWMAIPGAASLAWVTIHWLTGAYPLGLEPIFPGLFASIIIALVGIKRM
ncbi:MAG TPA: sodium:solute symporter family protein [bacterium]|nr:sodium:solute symporter family protein [bacterium]